MKTPTILFALLPLASWPLLQHSSENVSTNETLEHSAPLPDSSATSEIPPSTPKAVFPLSRRALSDRLTHRHTPVLAEAPRRAKDVLISFLSGVDQQLSEAEHRQVLGLMESSFAFSSRELEELRSTYETDPAPDLLVELLETSLEYTRADARLKAFHGGQYAVMEIRMDRQPIAFAYPQVRAFHMQPFGNRSVVVLVDESPFAECGLALAAYQEAHARHVSSNQSAPLGC